MKGTFGLAYGSGHVVSDKGDWRAMVGHDCDYRFRPNFWADALYCEFDEASWLGKREEQHRNGGEQED